jgi:hypothetical protein
MEEKLVLVELDIVIGVQDVTANIKKYIAQVQPGMRIIWNVVMKWTEDAVPPPGDVVVEIPFFRRLNDHTPENLFEHYVKQPITLQKTPDREFELSAVFESPTVQPNGPPLEPQYPWEWEYFFEIKAAGDILSRRAKIDPLVVISG